MNEFKTRVDLRAINWETKTTEELWSYVESIATEEEIYGKEVA